MVAEQARLSSEVTHWHTDGQAGAIAVAVATSLACQWFFRSEVEEEQFRLISSVMPYVPDSHTANGLKAASQLLRLTSVTDAASVLGNGSRITSQDTVPFCLWVTQQFLTTYSESMWQTVSAFGDLDTNCAIVGSIVVMANGSDSIPVDWLLSREPLNG